MNTFNAQETVRFFYLTQYKNYVIIFLEKRKKGTCIMNNLVYLFVSPLKNVEMLETNISNFEEGEHGIYFINKDGAKSFVNWNNIGTYALFSDGGDKNDT